MKRNRQINRSPNRIVTQETFVFQQSEIITLKMLAHAKASANRMDMVEGLSVIKHLTSAPLQTNRWMKCAKAYSKTDRSPSIAAISPQMNSPSSGANPALVRRLITQMRRMTDIHLHATARTQRIDFLTAMSSKYAQITASRSRIRQVRDMRTWLWTLAAWHLSLMPRSPAKQSFKTIWPTTRTQCKSPKAPAADLP